MGSSSIDIRPGIKDLDSYHMFDIVESTMGAGNGCRPNRLTEQVGAESPVVEEPLEPEQQHDQI